MKTSFALLSVTLALGTAVEGSPLNLAALLKRNNDKEYAEVPARSCVQVTSKQAGTCVSPANRQRLSEGTSVTLVDCKDALSWQLPEGKSGPIALCEDSSLVLDAGRDLRDGGHLSLYKANGTPQQEFKVNDDGTISVGSHQCLDTGRDGTLQTWTCDADNENQQFTATPVGGEEKYKDDKEPTKDDKSADYNNDDKYKDDKAPAQDDKSADYYKDDKYKNDKSADHHKDDQQEKKKEQEKQTVTKTEVRTDAHTDYKTATFNHTDVKTAFVTDIKTVTKDKTEIRTQTKEVPTTIKETVTKTLDRTYTETKPVTVYKTETKVERADPITKTQSVTITPKPVTETVKVTETPKPVTETKKVTITETPKPITKTETKYDTKYETKYETKYDTKYETKYATKYETKYGQARPTDYSRQNDDKKYEGEKHY